MPKWLVFGAIAAVILLVVVMSWLNRRSLEQPDEPAPPSGRRAACHSNRRAAASRSPPPRKGPVVLTATGPAWIQVTDQGKTLFQGELAPGQTYAVPPTAIAPLLKAGKPEALQIKVGTAIAPPVGPPGKVAANVSLQARRPDARRRAAAGAPAPAPAPARLRRRLRPATPSPNNSHSVNSSAGKPRRARRVNTKLG